MSNLLALPLLLLFFLTIFATWLVFDQSAQIGNETINQIDVIKDFARASP